MATEYDKHFVYDRLIAACQCVCFKRSTYNELMTVGDAKRIFQDWAKDEKKDDVFRTFCRTILTLTDPNLISENKALNKKNKSLTKLIESQAKSINKLDCQVMALNEENKEIIRTNKKLEKEVQRLNKWLQK